MTGHFKIVFSDIDGTLLDSQNRVPVKTREAILELEQRGIPFVLISARSPEGMEPIKRELDVYKRQHLFCRPLPGGGKRTGRRAARSGDSEQCGQQIQPHRNCGGDYQPYGQAQSANSRADRAEPVLSLIHI